MNSIDSKFRETSEDFYCIVNRFETYQAIIDMGMNNVVYAHNDELSHRAISGLRASDKKMFLFLYFDEYKRFENVKVINQIDNRNMKYKIYTNYDIYCGKKVDNIEEYDNWVLDNLAIITRENIKKWFTGYEINSNDGIKYYNRLNYIYRRLKAGKASTEEKQDFLSAFCFRGGMSDEWYVSNVLHKMEDPTREEIDEFMRLINECRADFIREI